MKDSIKDVLTREYGYKEPNKTDTAHGLHSNLVVQKKDAEGNLTEVRDVKNIITNDGADLVRSAIGNAPHTSAFRWTAIGSGPQAFASASTGLNSETAKKQNTYNTTAAFGQFSNVCTFTNLAMTVRESGLFNRSPASTGTMLAAQTFGAITLTTSDTLEVAWKVYFSEV